MKNILMFICALFLTVLFSPCAYAQSAEAELDRLKESIDLRLTEELDDDTLTELDDMGVAPSDSKGITSLDIRAFFGKLAAGAKDSIRLPAVMLGRIIAVSLIYSALLQVCPESRGLSDAFSVICTVCVITVMTETISSIYDDLKDSIGCINTFMISYIPVFTAVTAAGGAPVTAEVYSSSTVLICEVTQFISSQVLLPCLSLLTALNVVSAIDPSLKISGFSESVRKLTTWLLATTMLIFVGLLSIRGVTGSAADDLTSRTLRFAASSFIPVIGTSVSDAFLAVKGGMGLIRSAVGGFGMLAVFLIAVRPFVAIFSIKLAVWTGRMINELLDLRQTATFLSGINSVLSIAVSILISITAAFIIATAAVMSAVSGGN